MAAKLDYTWIADAAAMKGGVPPALLSALINAESAWNPAAVSSTGCTGFGQFCTAAARDYGLMGDGFDNRKDPALGLTAMVKYVADLKKQWKTWELAIAHYSGQLDDQGNPAWGEGYARYSAGQALLATIAMLDGTVVPVDPMPGDGPTIVVESITGREQATGRSARFIASVASVAAFFLIIGGIGIGCSPEPRQQVAEAPLTRGGFDFSDSTFRLEQDGVGKLRAVPLERKQ